MFRGSVGAVCDEGGGQLFFTEEQQECDSGAR